MNIVEQDIKARGIRTIREWRSDWGKFAREGLGIRLDKEQEEVLYSVQHNPRTTVKSGTARGKDFVTAAAAVSFFYLTPTFNPETRELLGNTKVALTAPTDRQVKNIMMPEISRIYNNAHRNNLDLPGILTTYGIRTLYDEWFLTGFKADEHNHEAWSGFHAVNVMFAVTEASGMADSIFNAIEGNLQGNSRLLIVFNDNTGIGYAAQSQKKPGWKKFRLDSLNAPNVLQKKTVIPGQVDWVWVNDRVKDWCTVISPSDFMEEEGDFYWENDNGKHCYRPNDLFRVKIRGMAPKASSGSLIPMEWVEIANEKWKLQKEQGWKIDKPLRLGVDVAGMGRDSSAFCFRRGYFLSHFEMIHSGGTANHMEVTGKVIKTLEANTDKFIGSHAQGFLDTIGEGAGVYSRVIELTQKKEFEWLKDKVHSVKFSNKAEFREKQLKDATGQYTFLNMRAYLYWALRDWLNPLNKTGAAMPIDDELAEELIETQWKFRSDGSIQIEPKEEIKKRIGRSPDKSDALVNTFYPIPDFDASPKMKKDVSKYFF